MSLYRYTEQEQVVFIQAEGGNLFPHSLKKKGSLLVVRI